MVFNFQADDLDILQGIVEESSEHLNGIEEGILRLENDFNPELLDSIFRAMHSVKGVASFVDFIPIKDTAHVLESFMTDMKKGLYACNTELTDILLRGVDILNVLIGQLALSIQNLDLGPGQENFEIVVDEGGFQSFINEAETLRHLMEQGEPPLAASADEPEIGTGQEAEAAKTVSNLMKMELSPLYEQMIGDFIEESSEHLETIEQKCVELEKNSSDPEILNSILRGFHSIKGGAGVIASMQESDQAAEPILAVKNLTHAVESLLQSYRNESIAPPTNVIDLILNVVDKVAYIVKSLDTMEEIDLSIDQLMERVNAMSIRSQEEINQQQAQTADKQVPQQFTAFINISTQALESMAHIVETVRQNKPVNRKRVKQYSRALKSIISTASYLNYDELVAEAQEVMNHLDKLSPEQDLVSEELIDILKRNFQRVKEMLDLKISTIHSLLEEVPPSYADKKLGEILVEEKKVTPDQLNWALNQQKKIGDILVDGGVIKPAELDMVLAKQAVAREKTRENDQTKAPADTGGQSIRVSQEKLDRLMNMIGELLISKNRIFHLANTINITYDMPPLAREVKSVAAELARISDELQNSIMSARMVPLKVLFQRFPRTIRDTARKAGKQVDLIIEGEDTELDKTVIEAINDPLVHMLRNAVDHGLESPADRRAAGKDETGQVRLRAYYQGIHAIIEISDDGRGMNPDEIKYKAVKKGLIKTEQIENMSNEDAYQLIFAPGFSTRDEVSELSGRGVGMDVVKTNVEKIGGSVNMNSRLGQGTTFTLKIPLSMSIIRGLMVETAGQRFVIPLDAIEETVKLPRKAIRKYKHKMVADIREEILPIVDLKEILGLDAAGAFNNHKKLSANDLISIVVLNIDGLKMGLIIDAFQKEQEFVVKALGEDLANLKIYTGASILGDGSVVLILNCAQLL